METLFSISLGAIKTEFSVRAVVDAAHNVVQFQGTCNGGVFVASDDYDIVRNEVIAAVELNQVNTDGLQ